MPDSQAWPVTTGTLGTDGEVGKVFISNGSPTLAVSECQIGYSLHNFKQRLGGRKPYTHQAEGKRNATVVQIKLHKHSKLFISIFFLSQDGKMFAATVSDADGRDPLILQKVNDTVLVRTHTRDSIFLNGEFFFFC